MENEKLFLRTSDINLAAALLCMGHDVTGIDPSNFGRVAFFFEKTQELDDKVDAYWRDDLRVSPKLYMYHRKELLTRISRNDIVN